MLKIMLAVFLTASAAGQARAQYYYQRAGDSTIYYAPPNSQVQDFYNSTDPNRHRPLPQAPDPYTKCSQVLNIPC